MKIKKIFLFALIPLFSMACNETPKEQAKQVLETPSESSIAFDHGKKWLVNTEMMPFVKTSEQLLKAYSTEANKDFTSLAQALEENNNKLIKNCTMKGQSHEELHKWLLPHIDLVKALETSESAADSKEIIGQLKASFQTL